MIQAPLGSLLSGRGEMRAVINGVSYIAFGWGQDDSLGGRIVKAYVIPEDKYLLSYEPV